MGERSVTALTVRFSSRQARDDFVARVIERRPELVPHLYLAKRRPDAIVEAMSDDDEQAVVELAGPDAQAFRDVQFQTLRSHRR